MYLNVLRHSNCVGLPERARIVSPARSCLLIPHRSSFSLSFKIILPYSPCILHGFPSGQRSSVQARNKSS